MPTRPATFKPTIPATPRHNVERYRRQDGRALHTGSKAWRDIREWVLARDLFRCQSCGKLVAGKGEAHIDHVDGDSANNPQDGSNWQTLCVSCHSIKTNRHDGGFGNRGRRRAT
ncbi:HNH endonuclease [Cupriavidus gilardii]|uniref:HNH endonuclease n=1 Tax=Cupriavidus gilardii TaxID=82541 RepID=UPI003B8A7D7F